VRLDKVTQRDKFAESGFFELRINELEKFYVGVDVLELFQGKYLDDHMTRTLDSGFRELRFLEDGLLNVETKLIPLKYSSGSELVTIYENHFKNMVVHYAFLAEELSKGHPQKVIYGYADQVRSISHQYSVYSWLAWCLCFETDFEQVRSTIPWLCSAGQDRLTDQVCASLVKDWTCADGCGYQNAFGLLEQVLMEKPEHRAEALKQYIDNWPKHIGFVDGSPIGFKCSISSSGELSKNDLVKGMNSHFLGFWAWEVALIVKFLGIDDSSFKDNDFYPYDLVHFTPPLSEQGFVINESNTNSMVKVNKTPELIAERRKDLTIKVDRASYDSAEFKEDSKAELYHAYLPKAGVSLTENIDFIEDSAVRYCVYVSNDPNDVAIAKGEIDQLVKYSDDWLVRDRLEKNMNELVDECGMSETYPFMDEVFLRLDNKYSDSSLVYCSRHKNEEVPPLMILRYAKFSGDQMLFIYCMVRDEELTYNDVAGHWLWCIDRYSELKF